MFCFTYLAMYVSSGVRGRRHCSSRDCHGEDAWQPASLTGALLLLSHLHNLHDNGWPVRLSSVGTPAFHLCFATAKYCLYVFQLPNGLNTCTHTHTHLCRCLETHACSSLHVWVLWQGTAGRHKRCFSASFPSVQLQQSEIIQAISLFNRIKFLLTKVPFSSNY